MWTSADDNRMRYVETLASIIQKNARRLARKSDMKQKVDGEFKNCAHVLFDELTEEAIEASQKA